MSFSDPTIHSVRSVVATARDYPNIDNPFTLVELEFDQGKRGTAILSIYFDWNQRVLAHCITQAINQAAALPLDEAPDEIPY